MRIMPLLILNSELSRDLYFRIPKEDDIVLFMDVDTLYMYHETIREFLKRLDRAFRGDSDIVEIEGCSYGYIKESAERVVRSICRANIQSNCWDIKNGTICVQQNGKCGLIRLIFACDGYKRHELLDKRNKESVHVPTHKSKYTVELDEFMLGASCTGIDVTKISDRIIDINCRSLSARRLELPDGLSDVFFEHVQNIEKLYIGNTFGIGTNILLGDYYLPFKCNNLTIREGTMAIGSNTAFESDNISIPRSVNSVDITKLCLSHCKELYTGDGTVYVFSDMSRRITSRITSRKIILGENCIALRGISSDDLEEIQIESDICYIDSNICDCENLKIVKYHKGCNLMFGNKALKAINDKNIKLVQV